MNSSLAIGPLRRLLARIGILSLTFASFSLAFGQTPDEEHQIVGPVVTVGDPNSPKDLPKAISDAYLAGNRRIVIRTGTYLLPSNGDQPVISLSHWNRARISGHGVTLVSTGETGSTFNLESCSRVEITDLTLTHSDSICFLGKLSDVVSEPFGPTRCIWTPEAGLGFNPQDGAEFVALDQKTKQMKRGVGFLHSTGCESLPDKSLHITFQDSNRLKNGDYIAVVRSKLPSKLNLINCRDCVLSNLTLKRNGDGVVEHFGGGNGYFDCRWGPGSKGEAVATSGNGLTSTGAYPGPDVESCELSGITCGRGIFVFGEYETVLDAKGSVLSLAPSAEKFAAGQPIRLRATNYYLDAFIKSVTNSNGQAEILELDRDSSAPAGAFATNPLLNGQSYKVINCKLREVRGSALDVSADSGIVEGNEFSGCASSAISGGPMDESQPMSYFHDLIVKSNQFKENGFSGRGPAIWIRGLGAIGNHNITIENNTFDSDYGGDVSIECASSIDIRNNSFSSAAELSDGLHRSSAVALSQASRITIKDNAVKRDIFYLKPFISTGQKVEGLDDQNGKGIH